LPIAPPCPVTIVRCLWFLPFRAHTTAARRKTFRACASQPVQCRFYTQVVLPVTAPTRAMRCAPRRVTVRMARWPSRAIDSRFIPFPTHGPYIYGPCPCSTTHLPYTPVYAMPYRFILCLHYGTPFSWFCYLLQTFPMVIVHRFITLPSLPHAFCIPRWLDWILPSRSITHTRAPHPAALPHTTRCTFQLPLLLSLLCVDPVEGLPFTGCYMHCLTSIKERRRNPHPRCLPLPTLPWLDHHSLLHACHTTRHCATCGAARACPLRAAPHGLAHARWPFCLHARLPRTTFCSPPTLRFPFVGCLPAFC